MACTNSLCTKGSDGLSLDWRLMYLKHSVYFKNKNIPQSIPVAFQHSKNYEKNDLKPIILMADRPKIRTRSNSKVIFLTEGSMAMLW